MKARPDPMPAGTIDLLFSRFCANDSLKVIASGEGAGMRIMDRFSRYSPESARTNFTEENTIIYDSKVSATKKITGLGYLFRKHILNYQEVRAA